MSRPRVRLAADLLGAPFGACLVGHGGTFLGFDAAIYACPETAQSAAFLANTSTSLLRGQLRKTLGLV